MPMIDTLTKAQDDFFSAVEQTNERVVSTVRNVTENMSGAAENVKVPERLQANFDKVEVPEFVQEIPTPKQVADLYFDFVTRSVEMNRAFTEQMISIFTGEGTKKAAKKPAAKKSTAKKAAPKAEAKKAEPKAEAAK